MTTVLLVILAWILGFIAGVLAGITLVAYLLVKDGYTYESGKFTKEAQP